MVNEISNLDKDVAKLGSIGKKQLRAVGRRLGYRKGGTRVAKKESQDKGKAVISYVKVEIDAVWVYLLGSPALDHCSLNLDCR